jgi:hypothetical protein
VGPPAAPAAEKRLGIISTNDAIREIEVVIIDCASWLHMPTSLGTVAIVSSWSKEGLLLREESRSGQWDDVSWPSASGIQQA